MSLLDLLRQQYLRGKVIDKYSLKNGNIALVVEDEDEDTRYHVEFRDSYKGPRLDNLYGLLKEPFGGKSEGLDRLINKNDTIELTVSYSKGPFREAYGIHSVSSEMRYGGPEKLVSHPYRSIKMSQYRGNR